MNKRVTLEEIAKVHGVSAVTVSKALKDQKGVSEQLKTQIRKTAEEMGYRRTSRAHNMRISHRVGVIIAERFLGEPQSFYWTLYRKLAGQIAEKGNTSLLEVVSASDEADTALPRILAERRCDGIIVIGTFRREYAVRLNHAPERTVPLVYLDADAESGYSDIVVSDNIGGGYAMTNYLLSLGHRRIAYVGTLLATSSIDDRYLGYTKALLRHGIETERRWIIDDRDRENGRLLESEELLSEIIGWKKEDMPTAYFCNCDLTAGRLIRAFEMMGMQVPGDVSVVGFDNHLPDALPNVGITTYETDTKTMVAKAVSRILRKIDNPGYAGGIMVVGGNFIERKSAKSIGKGVPYV